jgi:predicted metal-dependent phosphoesterase TrpH
MGIKLNLHTHSAGSYDALTTVEQIKQALDQKAIDQIAITDHDEINYALKAFDQLGEKIIVGEEVTTRDKTHVIGLFLKKYIPRGLSVLRTAELIKNQGGLVYIPHPFAKGIRGVGQEALDELKRLNMVDIIEGFNAWEYPFIANPYGRKVNNTLAWEYAKSHGIAVAAGSDSHTYDTLGSAYSEINALANKNSLIDLLKAEDVKHNLSYNKISANSFKAFGKLVRGKFAR